MRVFISWSGEPSKSVADAVAKFIERTVQTARPWISTREIRSGKRWQQEIGTSLSEAQFGVLVVTPGNLNAPWLLFEAGALSKSMKEANVVPLLCGGLDPSALPEPLQQFQALLLDDEGLRTLLADINLLTATPLSDPALKDCLDAHLPKFHETVRGVVFDESAPAPQFDRDKVLGDVHLLVQDIAKRLPSFAWSPPAEHRPGGATLGTMLDAMFTEARPESAALMFPRMLERFKAAVRRDPEYGPILDGTEPLDRLDALVERVVRSQVGQGVDPAATSTIVQMTVLALLREAMATEFDRAIARTAAERAVPKPPID